LDDSPSIQGLVGQVSFFHVRNLTIRDFTCTDLLKARFCIQIAEFENIIIENVHIEGDKDGIHLGVGRNFVIRNGVFKTFDDPIALNAHDYDVSNPTVGWIENGLIENCYDLSDATTTGFFCRILAGSWVDWFQGMKLQKSDIVVNNGRLYRVIASPDGKEYTSYTAPTHTEGYQTIDGIRWYMMQEGTIYNGGCKNVHFKDIYLQKNRGTAFSIHFDSGVWSRSYYPNSSAPVQSNIVFENIHIEGKLGNLVSARTPVDNIKFINLNWTNGNVIMSSLEGLDYVPATITFEKTVFDPIAEFNITADKNRTINLKITNSTAKQPDYKLFLRGAVTVSASDIPYYF
jgi:polygalacturonase